MLFLNIHVFVAGAKLLPVCSIDSLNHVLTALDHPAGYKCDAKSCDKAAVCGEVERLGHRVPRGLTRARSRTLSPDFSNPPLVMVASYSVYP